MDSFWKDKTIVAYIALAHHTRFIIPVMETLSRQGAQIKYIVGQAERSQEITAIEKGLEYAHIFDFLSDSDNDAVQNNYLALRNTFSKNLKSDFLLGLQPLTVTDKTLFSTAMEYVGFKNLFEKLKPDLCFVLHELNRWGKMFSFWAKKNNIPFITLQEGLGYNLDFKYSGHAQYSSLNLVWGERIKKKFSSYEVPEDKIILTGNIHLANEIQRQKDKRIRDTKRKEYHFSNHFISLLILSSKLPSSEQYKVIFNAVSDNKRLKMIVKFHPASKRQQMDEFRNNLSGNEKKHISFIHAEESVYDLISMSDLCILDQPSTTGLEALAFGKPLVKMDFGYSPKASFSFVDQGVAKKITAGELAEALVQKTDFTAMIDSKKTKLFLQNELSDTHNAVENACAVFKKIILANQKTIPSLPLPDQKAVFKWSIILPVADNPKIFLAQMEALATNSQDQGEFEIFFIEPEKPSKQILEILDSLLGDFKRITMMPNTPLPSILNQAAKDTKGEFLIFLDKNLAPLADWLSSLKKARQQHDNNKIFGARICDKNGRIVNAGKVVDLNNSPVSAYHSLNADFESALKERSFQITDHFIAIEKKLFFEIGGFTTCAGSKKFMDICLKAGKWTKSAEPVMYLPNLKLIFLEDIKDIPTPDDAIYFYGKWHGVLWESESHLLKNDRITPEDIAHAKLAKAMQAMR